MRHDRQRPQFSNNLVGSTSPYLLQHAHNPVFWYPWGKQAIARAREENKPIFLSIGYSTCYWCHVMEREVFENLSIASQMNRFFINIKIDREEYPALDDIYMVARQLMTHEGGWPNNLFLTPDLKPFFAGGTFSPEESHGRPSFPRVLEWMNYEWTTNQAATQAQADVNANVISEFLVQKIPEEGAKADIPALAAGLFQSLQGHFDGRAGGFFQAPKFPHENYLQFLLAYQAHTGDVEALEMATFALRKMAAGGLNDQVGAGFHRYAVDKQWYVPHFEKMLYTQGLLGRTYTDAARQSENLYLADVASSIFDFVSGAFTDSSGTFYAAIDAENNGIEGAFYAWSAEEIQSILEPEEVGFFTAFFALADIPTFPGHPETPGKVLILRKPMDVAARDHAMPYVQAAAMAGQLMNKLLQARNGREAPAIDNKIIVAWNGLMIDALAYGGRIFSRPDYVQHASIAANHLLEHAIDNDGALKRIIAGGRAPLAATLEDYAYLIRGLISLYKAGAGQEFLDAAQSLTAQVEERFGDNEPGYFFTETHDDLWVRIKSGDDSALPNPNAVMLNNHVELHALTGDKEHLTKARAMADYFLSGEIKMLPEYASMITAAMALHAQETGKPLPQVSPFSIQHIIEEEQVAVSARRLSDGEIEVTLNLKDGWHINMGSAARPELSTCQLDVQGEGVEVAEISYPEPAQRVEMGEPLKLYEGSITLKATLKNPAKGKEIRVLLSFQPCNGTTCYPVENRTLTI